MTKLILDLEKILLFYILKKKILEHVPLDGKMFGKGHLWEISFFDV